MCILLRVRVDASEALFGRGIVQMAEIFSESALIPVASIVCPRISLI